MRVPSELRAAIGLGTGARVTAPGLPPHELVPGLAWLPAVGLVLGVVAALAAAAVSSWGAWVAAGVGVTMLGATDGRWRGGALPVVATLVELGALGCLGDSARAIALLVAPMLARWALVVQCYGGAPVGGAHGLAALVGRARFREFAWASVLALGATLVLLDAVGLVVALVAALVTVGVRVVAYRRSGGLDAGALAATSALVETSALVLLASIGLVLGRTA
ncbi:MAG: hypothetical protein ACREQL_09540 [Candidatus Binatia bacterium]